MLVSIVNRYNLDGVAIDDEYSNCGEPKNLQYAAMAIKNNDNWNGRILTKALDYLKADDYFKDTKLGRYLDFGSEISYVHKDDTPNMDDSRFYTYLTPKYLAPNQIQIGITEPSYQDIDYGAAGQTDFWKWFNGLKDNGGIMVFNLGECSQSMTPYYQSGPITVTCNGSACKNSLIRFDSDERGDGATFNLSGSLTLVPPKAIAEQISAGVYDYVLKMYASNDSIEKLIKQNNPKHPDYKLVLNVENKDIAADNIQVSSDGGQVANKIAFDLNEFPYKVKVNISGFNICSTN